MRPFAIGLGLLAVSCGTTSCVARGARVRCPGGTRAIEDLAEGDLVMTVDPQTGDASPARITAIAHSKRECGTVSFAGGALTLTTDHPVFDPLVKGFFPAGDWLLGRRSTLLRSTDAGLELVRVERVEAFSRVDEVFDLTVDHPWHTFVADGIVVHNKTRTSCVSPDGILQSVRAEGDERAPCTCDGGRVGRWSCGDERCVDCQPNPDGGTRDGG